MTNTPQQIEAVLAGRSVRDVVERLLELSRTHPNAYPWDPGTDDLTEAGEAHAWNPQALAGRAVGYESFAHHFGTVRPGTTPDLKHYPYGPEHAEKIESMLKSHGYTPYYAGGRYGPADLAHKNYDTKALMIWDPSEGSGGDFGHRAYTDAWRKTHELAHALTKPIVNAKYGEAPRIGKLGHHRSQHEVERAVEWEWHAAHKQRELNAGLGIHVPDHVFHKELNTVLHDAVHRGVTGKFTNPDQEGFHPSERKVPLATSIGLVREHARRLGLTNRHQTFHR